MLYSALIPETERERGEKVGGWRRHCVDPPVVERGEKVDGRRRHCLDPPVVVVFGGFGSGCGSSAALEG